MENQKKQGRSFLREAVILTAASFAVKIIGVVFKIPLTNIMGDSIGIFTAAYSIYAMLFMLSTSGLPVAISRLVAASNERGRGREADRIALIALIAFGLIGLSFSLLLIVFAPLIAEKTSHPDSVLAMRMIAPSLFCICVCASVRGYYQGLRNMYPTAISQFIEAFFKMAVGLTAVNIAASKGASPEVQAACAISGVTVGTMFAMIFILIYRGISRKTLPVYTDGSVRGDGKLLKMIMIVALPVTLTAAALYFSQFLDTILIVNILKDSGEQEAVAQKLFSAYTGLSVPIYDLLPATLVFPIATSILPAISAAVAVKKAKTAARLSEQAIRISGIIAIPCGVFLLISGRWCIDLIYGADKWSEKIDPVSGIGSTALDNATAALSVLAFAVFFISIVSTANALLNAYGKPNLPFLSVLSGIAVLVVSEIILLYSPLGIVGAALSSVICYTVVMLLDLRFLRKRCGVRLKLAGMFARPLLCGLITAIATFLARIAATAIWRNAVSEQTDTRGAAFFILVISGIIMVIAYLTSLLFFRGIKEHEVRLLPKGDKIAGLLLKLRWLKPDAKPEKLRIRSAVVNEDGGGENDER
ncbi:MAG: polysaccharide biosynthesis protein [Clostridia bacterium]|nr:polysaccharide biosynthesis protein [Clostridia bacterium]